MNVAVRTPESYPAEIEGLSALNQPLVSILRLAQMTDGPAKARKVYKIMQFPHQRNICKNQIKNGTKNPTKHPCMCKTEKNFNK